MPRKFFWTWKRFPKAENFSIFGKTWKLIENCGKKVNHEALLTSSPGFSDNDLRLFWRLCWSWGPFDDSETHTAQHHICFSVRKPNREPWMTHGCCKRCRFAPISQATNVVVRSLLFLYLKDLRVSEKNGGPEIVRQPLLSANFLRSFDMIMLQASFGNETNCAQFMSQEYLAEFMTLSGNQHNRHGEKVATSWKEFVSKYPQLLKNNRGVSAPKAAPLQASLDVFDD